MNIRYFIIFMTWVAVVSDYILHPFYPHFFEARFGVTDPKEVGIYFSAICATVMFAFPFWALVSRRIHELQILVYTQIVAGLLALACFFITSYVWFWIASLTIIVFKGSYLLMYPYMLKVTKQEDHTHTIGLLSVIVHFGSILGAILGGVIIDFIHPAYIYLVMALGDFIQAGVSFYLLKGKQVSLMPIHSVQTSPAKDGSWWPKGMVLKVGIVTFVLYFSDFILRPFFVRYWESVSVWDSKIVSGLVYAVPALVAMTALWYNKRSKGEDGMYSKILYALFLALVGLSLQGYPSMITVFIGRIVYGWCIFQASVCFDALLFKFSKPELYAVDYSKVHFFQNLGVLIAATSAGLLVDNFYVGAPFIVALAGFAIVLALYYGFMYKRRSETVATDVGEVEESVTIEQAAVV